MSIKYDTPRHTKGCPPTYKISILVDTLLQKQQQLSRVRENQRRSRARKQEYIHELEQQLVSLKRQAQQKDVNHRLAMQGLEMENRRLRGLLSSAGIEAGAVDGSDSVAKRKVAIPVLRRGGMQEGWEMRVQGERLCDPKQPEIAEGGLSSTIQTPTTESAKGQTLCGCSEDDDSWPANQDILNTTLCAIADELISQYNTRGVGVAEIQRKLWAGFSRGATTGDGCRVQNQILFQVLDDISDD